MIREQMDAYKKRQRELYGEAQRINVLMEQLQKECPHPETEQMTLTVERSVNFLRCKDCYKVLPNDYQRTV